MEVIVPGEWTISNKNARNTFSNVVKSIAAAVRLPRSTFLSIDPIWSKKPSTYSAITIQIRTDIPCADSPPYRRKNRPKFQIVAASNRTLEYRHVMDKLDKRLRTAESKEKMLVERFVFLCLFAADCTDAPREEKTWKLFLRAEKLEFTGM